jgi:hypothetical protein
MLISLTRKFIFIANLKTASTAIEAVLRPFSEIALVESRFGKHMPYQLIEQRFGWVFEVVNRQDFLIFGVMRDPVGLVISLYNSHRDRKFKDSQRLYTGDMDFDEFLDKWAEKNKDQMRPQLTRFLAADGKIGANYIISYENLTDGLEYVAGVFGTAGLRQPPRSNVSEAQINRNTLTRGQLAWISERFGEDQRFMARYCDRRLSEIDQVSISDVSKSERDATKPANAPDEAEERVVITVRSDAHCQFQKKTPMTP